MALTGRLQVEQLLVFPSLMSDLKPQPRKQQHLHALGYSSGCLLCAAAAAAFFFLLCQSAVPAQLQRHSRHASKALSILGAVAGGE